MKQASEELKKSGKGSKHLTATYLRLMQMKKSSQMVEEELKNLPKLENQQISAAESYDMMKYTFKDDLERNKEQESVKEVLPQKKKNAMIYVVIGILAIVFLVGGFVVINIFGGDTQNVNNNAQNDIHGGLSGSEKSEDINQAMTKVFSKEEQTSGLKVSKISLVVSFREYLD